MWLKKCGTIFAEIVAKEISKNEARKLYENFIKSKVDKLKTSNGKGKNKRINIFSNLENIKSSNFDSVYLKGALMQIWQSDNIFVFIWK